MASNPEIRGPGNPTVDAHNRGSHAGETSVPTAFVRASVQKLRRVDESAPVLDDWSLKDVIAHVVSWGDELRSEIREILIDPTPHYSYLISSDRDYDAWNRSKSQPGNRGPCRRSWASWKGTTRRPWT